MGRGIFWLKLCSVRAASELVRRSPTSVDGKIILMVPWYRGFNVVDFDAHFHIPCHPVTLIFPSLVAELGPFVSDFGHSLVWYFLFKCPSGTHSCGGTPDPSVQGLPCSPSCWMGKCFLLFRGIEAHTTNFDTKHHIPRYLVTLIFPGLVAKLGPSISYFGALFGMVL